MSPSTRLVTAVSLASLLCRTIHVSAFHQELKIFHMSEIPLKHLFIKNLRKGTSLPEALFSTYVNLLESGCDSLTHDEFNKTIMEPFLESCYVFNDSAPVCEVSSSKSATSNVTLDKGVTPIPVLGTDVFNENSTTFDNPDVNLNTECDATCKNDRKSFTLKQKYKMMRTWKRVSKEKLTINSDEAVILRLLSFNILAQHLLEAYSYLYKEHDKRALEWERRKPLLLQEILEAKANVVCLQEMQEEHLQDFLIPFVQMGYDYLYKRRTGDKQDGLLLLYRADQFNLVDYAKVELYQSGIELLSRDNVGLIVKLSLKNCPDTQVVIATTHLLYNPRRNDVRLGQTQILFAELERIAFIEHTSEGGSRYHPIILTGDFNLEPYTGVYNFITNSSFEYLNKGRNLEPSEHRRLSNLLIPARLHITDNCQHFNILKKRLSGEGSGNVMLESTERKQTRTASKEEAIPKDSPSMERKEVDENTDSYQKISIHDGREVKFSSGRLTHPFNMSSVYKHVDDHGRREATTHQGRWITVDYIFYSDIEPLERYTLPTVDDCTTLWRIPNSATGSDHLCLGASFKLSKKRR